MRFSAARPRWRWGRPLRSLGALLLLGAMAALVWTWPPERIEVVAPIRIVDGDSLFIRQGDADLEIRVRGIDAVEYRQSCSRGLQQWACGVAARDALRQIGGGRPLHCHLFAKDNYRRTLAQCRTRPSPDGVDIGAEMVRQGWAVATGDEYRVEEAEARARRRGIWQGDFTRPAEWRADNAARGE